MGSSLRAKLNAVRTLAEIKAVTAPFAADN